MVSNRALHRSPTCPRLRQEGFALAELLMAIPILLLLGLTLFGLLNEAQRSVTFQADLLAAQSNLRIAMETIERHVRHAGNDPFGRGGSILLLDSSRIQLRTDLTGGAGVADPDKGDPDGDFDDAYETITLRHNPATQTLEIISGAGSAVPVAEQIMGISFQLLDSNGQPAPPGTAARRLQVHLTVGTALPDPRDGRAIRMTWTGDIQIRPGKS